MGYNTFYFTAYIPGTLKIFLIAVGTKMPDWVNAGFEEYRKRFPRDNRLELIEIPAQHRGKNADIDRTIEKEGELMLEAVPRGAHIVTLDIPGKQYTTPQLAQVMNRWRGLGQNIALLVGGAEGLSAACRQKADESWSLSSLTMPHPLVRVVIAEALYRAWSLTAGLPYHRE